MPVIPKTFDKDNNRFDKNPNDLFQTDIRLAIACLELMPFKDYILDVGCGKGVWGKAARQTHKLSHLTGVDIIDYLGSNPNDFKAPYPYDVYDIEDYLTYGEGLKFDLIIGNPPFSNKDNRHLAEDIVLHSFDLLNDNGYLGLLLKTEFLASLRRFENIFSTHAPLVMYQLIPRPYFNNLKGSNTIEYAFFIWQKQENTETKVKWLNWK